MIIVNNRRENLKLLDISYVHLSYNILTSTVHLVANYDCIEYVYACVCVRVQCKSAFTKS